MSGGIFISYRRSDSASFAGRIADFFGYKYPGLPVFFDVVAIEPGENFVDSIRSRLSSSEVILAIIGESWLEAKDASGGRRLDDENDFVRLELAMALEMGARVIPVLLDNAQMPSEVDLPADLAKLAFCNAEFMRGAAFQRDAEHLGAFVQDFLNTSTKTMSAPAPRSVTSDVKASLVAAFESYRDGADNVMVVEDAQGRFVQFMRDEGGDGVLLDLPAAQLTAQQEEAAERILTENYKGGKSGGWGGDRDFAFQLDLPLDPSYLSYLTLGVFEQIYGQLPDSALKVDVFS